MLSEDLRELDHVSVVLQRFGEVDHGVRRVLLVAGTSSGKECTERVYSDGVTLLATTCSITGGFPFLRGVGNDLCDTLVKWVRRDRQGKGGKEECGLDEDHGEPLV